MPLEMPESLKECRTADQVWKALCDPNDILRYVTKRPGENSEDFLNAVLRGDRPASTEGRVTEVDIAWAIVRLAQIAGLDPARHFDNWHRFATTTSDTFEEVES
jgi:hypothetical protein